MPVCLYAEDLQASVVFVHTNKYMPVCPYACMQRTCQPLSYSYTPINICLYACMPVCLYAEDLPACCSAQEYRGELQVLAYACMQRRVRICGVRIRPQSSLRPHTLQRSTSISIRLYAEESADMSISYTPVCRVLASQLAQPLHSTAVRSGTPLSRQHSSPAAAASVFVLLYH